MISLKYEVLQSLFKLHSFFSKKVQIRLRLLAFLMVIASALEMLSIGSVVPFLSAITNPGFVGGNNFEYLDCCFKLNKATNPIIFFGILFIAILIISSIFRLYIVYFQNKISNLISSEIGALIFSKILNLPYEFHMSKNSSEIITLTTTKITGIIYNTIIPVLVIINAFTLLLLAILSITYFNIESILIAIFPIIAFYFIIGLIIRKNILKFGIIINDYQNLIIKLVQESLGNLRDILLDGTQNVYLKKYSSLDGTLKNSISSLLIIGALPKYIIEITLMISLIAWIIFISHYNEIELSLLVPLIGTIAFAIQRILPFFQQAYNGWTLISGDHPTVLSIIEILDKPIIKKGVTPIIFNKSIELQNVSYSYSGYKKCVLNNISIDIKKGSKIGFVGETGSGKSTLIDLLIGHLKPSSGMVIVDNCILTNNTTPGWQKKIAHVPQSIYLADVSILENIAFSLPKELINIELVRHVAKLANIHDDIDSMEAKYETRIGERGVKLSGGQLQRIGIARALYRNVEVLILDEATSALDEKTENIVLNNIYNYNPDLTIIIVTHKPSTLKFCQKAYKINSAGEIRDIKIF